MSSDATPNNGAAPRNDDAVFTVSVAAQLVGMHAQTLRQYDRIGLVSPSRTKGRGRRYSGEDIRALREVQRLTQEEGVNLAGVQLALGLRAEIDALKEQVRTLEQALRMSSAPVLRVFAADSEGQVRLRPVSQAASREQGGAASGSQTLRQPSSPNLKAVTRTGPAGVGAASLGAVAAQRRAHGHALLGPAQVRGWQQLALLSLQRRYRDRVSERPPEQ